jgi:hypothetical protein
VNEIDLKKEPHENPGEGNPKNEEQNKVVRWKGNIPYWGIEDPSQKKIAQRGQEKNITHVKNGKKSL